MQNALLFVCLSAEAKFFTAGERFRPFLRLFRRRLKSPMGDSPWEGKPSVRTRWMMRNMREGLGETVKHDFPHITASVFVLSRQIFRLS